MAKKKRIWGTLDPFFEGGPILGRTVANTGFLNGLLEADPFDEYHFFLPGRRVISSLLKYLERTRPELLEAKRIRLMDRSGLAAMLAANDYHCFHLSDCMTTQPYLARLRNRVSTQVFPITGPIHSLSYVDYPKAFLQHLWPGTTRRDAIVCTSEAGRLAVERYFRQLREGFGLSETSHPAPALQRIPLGVSTACAQAEPGTDGPIKILAFGRISHHSKMDLVPLIRGLHRLVQDGLDPNSFELVLAGWSDKDDRLLEILTELAANAGISMSVHLRPNASRKSKLFQEAAIFVSIADNPQETFGITLIEAAAHGLPVVASDYDGYRDIVVHGETGLLVPTTGPAATPDANLKAPLTFDSHYHLGLAQTTAVDLPALAGALRQLLLSPALRANMGGAGRKRAVERFAWPVVLEQYLALWDRLWAEPAEAGPLRDIPHPLAPDFGRIFGHYATRVLGPELTLEAGRLGNAFYRDLDFPNVYAGLKGAINLDVARKLVFFARNPVDSATLIRKVSDFAPQMDVTQIENHILWSLKQDILQIKE